MHVRGGLYVPVFCLYPLKLCPPGWLEMLLSSKHLFQPSTPMGDKYFAGRFYLSAWAEPGKFLCGEYDPSGFIATDTFEAADLGNLGPFKLWLSFHSFCELS